MTLVPSPDAIITLSARYDGFQPLLAALHRLSHQAAVDVIAAGLGVEGKAVKDISRQVAVTGAIDLMGKLVEFVMICANGGRPLKEADDDGAENPPAP